MNCVLLTFGTILFASTLAPIKGFECKPHTTYQVDCNRCWCISDGVTVCTKMSCPDIPHKFWNSVRLDKNLTTPMTPNELRNILQRKKSTRSDKIIQRLFADLDELKRVASKSKKTRSNPSLQNFLSKVDELKDIPASKQGLRKRSVVALLKMFDTVKEMGMHRRRSDIALKERLRYKQRKNPGSWIDERENVKEFAGLEGFEGDNQEIMLRVYEDLSVLENNIDY